MHYWSQIQKDFVTELEALKAIADATPRLVWMTAPDGALNYANPEFVRYTDRHYTFSLGDRWMDLCHPDEKELVKAAWCEKIGVGEAFETEFRFRRRDGAYRWHHVSVLPLKDKSGRIYCWYGTNTDAHDKRSNRDRMFRALFDNTRQFIGLLSPEGKLLEGNKTAMDFAGIKLQDVKGKYFWDTPWWAHSESQKIRVKEGIKAAAQGEFQRFEARHVSPTGRSIFVDFSLTPIFDDDGKVILIIPEGRDITEQVLAQERLKASERHYRRIFENASDLIVSMTVDGAIIYANPAWHNSLEFEIHEMQLFNFFEMIVPQDKMAAQKAFNLIREGAVVEQFETTLQARSGRRIQVEGNFTRDHYEDMRLVLAIFRDVSSRREMERRVSEFYSNVSHELRTPLTSIRASLGLIEGGLAGVISSKATELIHIARLESDRMIRMINDILDIKKVESGKLELRRARIPSETIVEQTVHKVQGMADEFGVFLKANLEPVPMIEVDHDRIVQVLLNFVSNALKFSPPGETVSVNVSQRGGMVRFSVKDCGPGVAPEDVCKLFEMFQQLSTPTPQNIKGTGLGLAISKSLIELHGGRVGVNTKLGEGSCFWFELPVCETESSQSES